MSQPASARRVAVLAAALCGGHLLAQTPSWSPEFAAAGLGGRVFAMTTHQAELYAGGSWFAAKGGLIHGLARFDGATWRPVGSGVDLLNGIGFDAEPQVLSLQSWNNELYAAGTFDRAGGQAIAQIARWNGQVFAPLGSGIQLSFGDAQVYALAVYNSELYAAGFFDQAGGQPVHSIARWNGSSWSTIGSGITQSISGVIGTVRALHVHSNTLYVAGDFDRAGGVVAHNIAAWNGTAWSAVGGGSSFIARALETYGTDLVAAAQFQIGSNVEMLARWNGSSWSAVGNGGPDLPVAALRTVGTSLYAGGFFTRPGQQMAQFDGQGWHDIGGVSGVFSGITTPFVWALHESGGQLFVGGEFTTVGRDPGHVGAIGSTGIAAFDGTDWHGLGTGLGLDRPLRRLVPWRGGWVGVGGFGEAGDTRAIGLAFYDGDRWTTMGAFDGGVYDAVVYRGDLVVSGAFQSIDGVPYNGIARHDGSGWQFFTFQARQGLCVHGNDLYASGSSSLLRFDGTTFTAVATVPAGPVSQLYSHQNGLLYVAADASVTHGVYAWNGTQLTSIGTPNDFIQTLGGFGNDLIVGGRFTSVSGTPANLMARWNGASWSALPAVSGYATYAVAELDGVLHAAVSGDPRGFTLALRNGAWQAVGTPPEGVPTLFFVDDATASLYASGDFFTAGGLPSRSLAEWRTQPAWRNRLHGLGGAAGAPELRGRGAMLGGSTAQWSVAAPANLPVLLGLGLRRIDAPLLGGVMVPLPDVVTVLVLDAQGQASYSTPLPHGLPAGIALHSQAWIIDATGPQGFTASNALQCVTQ